MILTNFKYAAKPGTKKVVDVEKESKKNGNEDENENENENETKERNRISNDIKGLMDFTCEKCAYPSLSPQKSSMKRSCNDFLVSYVNTVKLMSGFL